MFYPECDAEIIEKHPFDPMLDKVICPFCGCETTVGHLNTYMGYIGHSDKTFEGGCYWYPKLGLRDKAEYYFTNDYETFCSGEWYKEGFKPYEFEIIERNELDALEEEETYEEY